MQSQFFFFQKDKRQFVSIIKYFLDEMSLRDIRERFKNFLRGANDVGNEKKYKLAREVAKDVVNFYEVLHLDLSREWYTSNQIVGRRPQVLLNHFNWD